MKHYMTTIVHEVSQHVSTRCTCGKFTTAAVREDQAEHARELGYPDAWAMNREHDMLHARLAGALGLPYSPALFAVVHGEELNTVLAGLEEDMVLATQRFLNAWRAA